MQSRTAAAHSRVVYIENPSPITIVPGDVAVNGVEQRLSVSGSIRSAASSHKAFLVDGLMRVDSSYTIEPNGIGFAHELL